MLGRDWKGRRRKGDSCFHNKERRTVTISSGSSLPLQRGALGKDYKGPDKVALQTEDVVQACIFSH